MARSILVSAVLALVLCVPTIASDGAGDEPAADSCKGDINGDGYVDTTDMNLLLMQLFTCDPIGVPELPPPCYDPAMDFDNSGTVDTTDMNTLLFHLFINGDSDNGYRSPCMP